MIVLIEAGGFYSIHAFTVSMMGRICGKGVFSVRSGREWEWWTVKVVIMNQVRNDT